MYVMYIWEVFGRAYWRPRREDWWCEITMPRLEWQRRDRREMGFWSHGVRRGGWKEAERWTWSRRKASAWEPVEVHHQSFKVMPLFCSSSRLTLMLWYPNTWAVLAVNSLLRFFNSAWCVTTKMQKANFLCWSLKSKRTICIYRKQFRS